MTRALLDLQAELPRSLPLFRHTPARIPFSWRDWNPSLVRVATDLPPYLILGELAPASFMRSPSGWSARWQGLEEGTHFDVSWRTDTDRWELQQHWCGQNGGYSIYPTRLPLDRLIGQTLYMSFPCAWDDAAKTQFEAAYQLTVVKQAAEASAFCGIPDGAFRTIIFPIAVRNLRPVRQWIQDLVEESPPAYPVNVEAKRVFQAINHVEGKAPAWTAGEAVSFNHSVVETGLVPLGFPVREQASDGAAAWTLRREIYFLFISLPFAGLADFLSRMASANGPIRRTEDPDFRFELRPVVLPTGTELQYESLAFWDRERTTRSFLQFAAPGEENTPPAVDDFISAERAAPVTLAKIEAISDEVVASVEQIFQQIMKGQRS